jgi:hypothetical protein
MPALARSRPLRWLAFLALIVVLILPFFLVDVPPVQDYPNHLARLYVLAFGAGDPILSAIYAPRWSIIPNLALDLIGPPLLHVLPVHVAGRLLLAAALLLPLLGVAAYHRAAFGVRSYWPLAAGLTAYNAVFLLGFLNFLYGIGFAFLGAALWMATRERQPVAAVIGGALATILVFLCHVFALLFFALLIGSHELARLWRQQRVGGLTIGAVARAAIMVGIALAPAAILYSLSPFAGAHGAVLWDSPARKLFELFVPFLTYSKMLGLVTGLSVITVMILFRREFVADQGSLIALVVLFAVYLVAPGAVKGGSFVDTRIPLLMGLLLFAGFRPSLAARQGAIVAVGLILLFLVRSASIALAWYGHRQDLAEFRQTIAPVEPGARVLVVSPDYFHDSALANEGPASRAIPNLSRTDRHIAALLLIERRAFWPLLFADPRQQPLVVLPPYDRIALPLGEPPDFRLLAKERLSPDDLVGAPYLKDWRSNFDYVLLMEPGAAGNLPEFLPDRLELSAQTDFAALFKVRR